MNRVVEVGHLGEKLPLEIVRNQKAKRMRLRIDAKNMRAVLVIPKRGSEKKGVEFALSHASWIAAKLKASSLKPRIEIKDTEEVLLFGEKVTIVHQGVMRGVTQMSGDILCVYGEPQSLRAKVVSYIKDRVKDIAWETSFGVAQKIRLKPSRITVRDTSTRWGSCNASRQVSICWRLAFAPKEVLEYVIIHELCHLKHMNHSRSFWALLQSLVPDYKSHMKWLKANGAMLQGVF